MIQVYELQILKADSKSYELCDLELLILTQLLYFSCKSHESKVLQHLNFE